MLITSTVEICIQQLDRLEEMVLPRSQLCYRGLGSRNSVRLSVCHTRAL